MSIPNHIAKALWRSHRNPPAKTVHSPENLESLTCRAKVQCATQEWSRAVLSASTILLTHQVVGVFLYCARTLDNTMLVTVNDLSHQQDSATTSTMDTITHLLDYVDTHPIAKLRCHRSNMILHVHGDGSYLYVLKSCSRLFGCFFFQETMIKLKMCHEMGKSTSFSPF